MSSATIVAGVAVVTIPAIAWFAVPALNRALGRPLQPDDPRQTDWPDGWFSWQSRVRTVMAIPVALLALWLLACYILIRAFLQK